MHLVIVYRYIIVAHYAPAPDGLDNFRYARQYRMIIRGIASGESIAPLRSMIETCAPIRILCYAACFATHLQLPQTWNVVLRESLGRFFVVEIIGG